MAQPTWWNMTTLLTSSIASLRANGWTVSEGSMAWAPFGSLSNPEGTYGTYSLYLETAFPEPSGSFCDCISSNDESVAPQCKAYGPNNPSGAETVCGGSFVLGPSDAVVYVGLVPPVARYFALQTNVNAHWEANGSLWFPEASTGDAVNQLLLPDWGEPTVVASLADSRTARAIQDAFDVNVTLEVLSGVNFWSGKSLNDPGFWDAPPDVLKTIGRVSCPENMTEMQAYTASSTAVLLIRAPPNTTHNAMPPAPLRERRATADMTGIADALHDLHNSVVDTLESSFTTIGKFNMVNFTIGDPAPLFDLNITHGVPIHYSTRDAYYAQADPTNPHGLVIPFYDLVVALGVSTTTGMHVSTYDNLALSAENHTCFAVSGRAACTPTHDFETSHGTAAAVFGGDPRLFAVAWARDCSATPWAKLSRACIQVPYDLVPPNASVSLLYRAYLNPHTAVAPADDDVEAPVILAYSAREDDGRDKAGDQHQHGHAM